jgi:pimeloyl-ACP methyl ester carboxylesterase
MASAIRADNWTMTPPRQANPPADAARLSHEARRAFHLTWKTTDVQGRAAAYGEAGQGRPVLFLHGWGLDHKAYKAALRRLVETGLRVLAPAMPGFGGTDGLPGEDRTITGYADWVSDFLEAVGMDRTVMAMGHSFGGGVAIELAYRHPEHVDSLVLVNSIGSSTWSGSGSTVRTMAQRPLWDWGLHFPGDLWPLRQARKVLPVIVAEGVANLAKDPRSFWQVAGIARHADLTVELDALKQRRLPVAVVWGRRDQVITHDAFEQMCRTLGDPTVVTVEGSHSWLISDPAAFGEVITNVMAVADRTTAPISQLKTLAAPHHLESEAS